MITSHVVTIGNTFKNRLKFSNRQGIFWEVKAVKTASNNQTLISAKRRSDREVSVMTAGKLFISTIYLLC